MSDFKHPETIEEWRMMAGLALSQGGVEGARLAAGLIVAFDFDLAFGGPLARLDEDGEPLSDEEVNMLSRAFGMGDYSGFDYEED